VSPWQVVWLSGPDLLGGERREPDEDGQQQQLLHGGEPNLERRPATGGRASVAVLLACDSAA
jgi:hypothetical protein